jgi:thymidylate synthase
MQEDLISSFGVIRRAINADAAYSTIIKDVLEAGQLIVAGETESVGSKRTSKEILHYSLVIEDPRQRLLWKSKRSFNLPGAVARFVWIMAGSDRLKDIEFYWGKKVTKFSDDGVMIPGSCYGQRMLNSAPGCNQIQGIIKRLRNDEATRRAAVAVYRAEDAVRSSSDIPCTFGLNFHNRSGVLHASVVMRSNNAWILFPYNLFEFSLLSEAIAAEVGLSLGAMHYYAMSMHVYAEDFLSAAELTKLDAPVVPKHLPAIPPNPSPMSQIQALVKLEAEARHASAGFSSRDFRSKWVDMPSDGLDPYWQQFYFLLLLAMCEKQGFHHGIEQLQPYFAQPWKDFLKKEVKPASPAPIEIPEKGRTTESARHTGVLHIPPISLERVLEVGAIFGAEQLPEESRGSLRAGIENFLKMVNGDSTAYGARRRGRFAGLLEEMTDLDPSKNRHLRPHEIMDALGKLWQQTATEQ